MLDWKSWEAPGGALRGSRTLQDSLRGVWRAPGSAGSIEGALGGKATIFACYLQQMCNIDKKVDDMHNDYAMSDDFIAIIARVNFKSGHSTRE